MLGESIQDVRLLCEVVELQVNQLCLNLFGDLYDWNELIVVNTGLGAYLAHEIVGDLVIKLNLRLSVLLANLFVGRENTELLIDVIEFVILKCDRDLNLESFMRDVWILDSAKLVGYNVTEHASILRLWLYFQVVVDLVSILLACETAADSSCTKTS